MNLYSYNPLQSVSLLFCEESNQFHELSQNSEKISKFVNFGENSFDGKFAKNTSSLIQWTVV